MPSTERRRPDFAVLTIVPEAFDAARRILGLNQREDPEDDDYIYYSGDVPAADGSGSHFVVCGAPLERGTIAAATFTYRMILTWRPLRLLVADVGGGVFGKDGLLLGDVVAHETLHYYELQKRVPSGYKRRFITTMPSTPRLRVLARDVQSNNGWYESIGATRPMDPAGAAEQDGDDPSDIVLRDSPELTLGEIIVGDKLLGDPNDDLLQELLSEFDKAKAVEMESAGVAHSLWAGQRDIGGAEFLVLRGISDFVNREGNQETRDLWKPYAAEAAVAAAKAIIQAERANQPTPSNERAPESNQTAPESEPLDGYRRRLRADLAEDPNKPPFPLTVESDDATSLAVDIADVIRGQRRTVLLAQAGAGKSELLKRLARDVTFDCLPVLIDLKRLRTDDTDRLLELDPLSETNQAIDVLLSRAIGDIAIATLQSVVNSHAALLMVDGLNEVDPDVADRIIDALNNYVRSNENISALVTDRAASGRYAELWRIVKLNPLADGIVASVLDNRFGEGTYASRSEEERGLLSIPFFLQIALEGRTPDMGSRANALRQFFIQQVGLSDAELNELARAALSVYTDSRSRSFPGDAMRTRLGNESWTKLVDASVASATGSEARFQHQLFHDFLTSVALLEMDPTEWKHELFDAVTFHTSSVDPLTLALAQIADPDQGDRFLRALEDWNWRVTMNAMGLVEKEGHLKVGRQLRIALLANLAEKRFDPVTGSASDAEGLLEKFEGEDVAKLLTGASVFELARSVSDLPVEEPEGWFDEWRSLFTREVQLTDGTSGEITHPDALEGWTAANVIKRFPLTERQDVELGSIYESRRRDDDPRSQSIRWRIVHALGTTLQRQSVDLLLRAAVEDDYLWVRYGAVRSLMEIAARELSVRDVILDGLRQHLQVFSSRERIQLVRSSMQRATSDDWCKAVGPLLRDIPLDDLTEREQANLRNLLSEFERTCA